MPQNMAGSPVIVHIFDVDKVFPGDILLTRVLFNIKDRTTYKSKAIQKATGEFSHAALCIDHGGMFIEAVLGQVSAVLPSC